MNADLVILEVTALAQSCVSLKDADQNLLTPLISKGIKNCY